MASNKILILAAMAFLAAHPTAATWGQVTAQQPETFYIAPQQQAVLQFKVDASVQALDCAVTDYWDQQVAGVQPPAIKDGVAALTVTLPRGFYQVSFPQTGQAFGVVALEPANAPADAFFCVDAALSWASKPLAALRPNVLAALRRCGISVVRERVWLGSVATGDGTFNWQADHRYQELRELYSQSGLTILEVSHDCPAWMGQATKNPYPQDLPALAKAWGGIARQWHGHWGGVEVWNEPDISFGGNLPADQYVPIAKAISFGLAAADAKTPVGAGVFTGLEPAAFRDTCARSGLLGCVDFISYHNYDTAVSMENQVRRYRDWLRANSKESMPLWITECGYSWTRGPARPPTGQDARSAMEIVAKATEARACGVQRYFPFVYMFYEENEKNFSMIAADGTPFRPMAAWAQCARALAGKAYIGDLAAFAAPVKLARVFSDGKQAVALLYTGTCSQTATAALNLPAGRIEGIDGRTLTPGQGSVPDGLTYVFMDCARMAGLVKKDTSAAQLNAAAQAPPAGRPAPSAIVLQNMPDLTKLGASPMQYDATGIDPARFPLRIRANNFSAQNVPVHVGICLLGSHAVLEGSNRDLDVPGQSFAEANWELNTQLLGDGPVKRFIVVAIGADGRTLDELAITVGVELSLDDYLALYAVKNRLPIEQLANWQRNIVGDGQMTMTITPDNHWVLTVMFAAGDPWVYPIFKLPAGVSLANMQALVIRAKCGQPAAVRVIVREANRSCYFTSSAIIPADGQWHAALIPFADLSPLPSAGPPDPDGKLEADQIDAIMVGMNSTAKQNTLEVSELYAVRGGK